MLLFPATQIIASMSRLQTQWCIGTIRKEKNISKEFTGYEISTAEYQAWLAGYNGQAEKHENRRAGYHD